MIWALAYLLTVATAFVLLIRAFRRRSVDMDIVVGVAFMLASLGPIVLLAMVGLREPRHIRRARRRAEIAEFEAREAKAVAERLAMLGLGEDQ